MLRSLLENEERPAKWAERSWLLVLRIGEESWRNEDSYFVWSFFAIISCLLFVSVYYLSYYVSGDEKLCGVGYGNTELVLVVVSLRS